MIERTSELVGKKEEELNIFIDRYLSRIPLISSQICSYLLVDLAAQRREETFFLVEEEEEEFCSS